MKRRILAAVASVLLAFVAVLGLGARPALAEETQYTAIGGQTSFTKNLVVDDDANIPDVTFAYTINRGTAVAATSTSIEILSSDVAAAVSNAVFTHADTARRIPGLPNDPDPSNPTEGKMYAQKTVTVTFPQNSFTKPGVYRYEIHETNGSLPGVVYDSNLIRYLDVFVVADPETNELSIHNSSDPTSTGYVLRTVSSNIGKDNTYTTNPDAKSSGFTNSISQYDFTFSKSITGNQGDKNKRFTFTLSISGANPGTYPVTAVDVTTNPTSITVQNDGTATAEYSLTNGSSIKVLGLNQGASCVVTENPQDYSAMYSVDGATAVAGSASGAITLADANHSVAFTNTREGVIPTGVILTVAPFAIGLMLFGALTVLFVSKSLRRSV